MANKKITEYGERILGYLIRKGSLCNSYKIARELEMERFEVLEILNKLAQEGKVRLRSGSVKAITKELTEEENIKTKSEVEELKERVEELEKCIGTTFNQIKEAIQIGSQKISREDQAKGDGLDDPENIKR